MTNEQATELLALMADHIKATDRLNETFERRFTQQHETMLNGFLRMEDKFDALLGRVDHLTERVDHLTERVDYLTEEVREVKSDVRLIKAEAQTTNRRLSATFDQTGQLTEKADAAALRITHVE